MNTKDPFYSDSRSLASSLLAFTVKELFPQLSLAGGGATLKGFYYDFIGSFPLEKQVLCEVEERMMRAISQKISVCCKEMSVASAKEYFYFHKEFDLGEALEEYRFPTVFVVEIGSRLFLIDRELDVENLGAIGAVKLFFVESVLGGVRIHGTALPNKMLLKEFCRNSPKNLPESHEDLAKKKSLFLRSGKEGWLWLSEGMRVFSLFQRWVENLLLKKGFFISSSCSVRQDLFDGNFFFNCQEIFELEGRGFSVFSLFENVTVWDLNEWDSSFGLLDEKKQTGYVSCLFCKKELLLQEVISSLRFMVKIFTMLGLEYRIVLAGKLKGDGYEVFKKAISSLNLTYVCQETNAMLSLEFRAQDRIGLEWLVSCIHAPKSVPGGVFRLPVAWIFGVQRLIALLLEVGQGALPYWLQPTQVVVLPVQESHQGYGESLVDRLKSAGIRAEMITGEFKVSLSKALQKQIGCIAVVGDREAARSEVTLRGQEGENPLTCSLLEFVEMLKCKFNRSDDSEL